MRVYQTLMSAGCLMLGCSDATSSSSGPDGGVDGGPEFVEFAWQEDTPDPMTERLCDEAAAPDDAPDTTFISCDLEGATFASSVPEPPPEELTILAYNILRGFEVDAQLDAMTSGSSFPQPDILLLSEVDRGCQRTDFRNIARDYAQRLGYYYVYATEFVELPSSRGATGPYNPPLCEHGNAIVSRYPLGNVRQIRHAQNRSWYTPPEEPEPDEPRLGGRIAIAADARLGDDLIRLYVLHLESTISAADIRDAQAEEIARDAESVTHPVIVGGDFNTFGYFQDLENNALTEPAVQSFVDRGFADAHEDLVLDARYTSFDPFALVIDLILVRGISISGSGRCEPEACGTLSDHLPIWSTVSITPTR